MKNFTPRRSFIARAFDVAFLGRMGAGFVGTVTRSHPAPTIDPCLPNQTTPPTAFGQAVVVSGDTTNSVRPLTTTDTAVTQLWGVTVRPFPQQAAGQDGNYGQANFGPGAPPSTRVVDVLKRGSILVQLNTGSGVPNKGSAVFIWVAATVSGHVQGQYETAASAGNTCALDASKYQFNGPADATGVTELYFV